MKATVQIEREDAMRLGPREVECAVRLGMQGYGSVEIAVRGLPWLDPPPSLEWWTIDRVLAHPRVLGVTFRGPWSGTPTDQNPILRTVDDRKPIVR